MPYRSEGFAVAAAANSPWPRSNWGVSNAETGDADSPKCTAGGVAPAPPRTASRTPDRGEPAAAATPPVIQRCDLGSEKVPVCRGVRVLAFLGLTLGMLASAAV
jgi:hypothetical protein